MGLVLLLFVLALGFLYLWIGDVGIVSISILNSLCVFVLGLKCLFFFISWPLFIEPNLYLSIFLGVLSVYGLKMWALFFFFTCFGDSVYCCVLGLKCLVLEMKISAFNPLFVFLLYWINLAVLAHGLGHG